MDRRLKIAIILLFIGAMVLSIAAHVFAVFPGDREISQTLREINNPGFSLVMQGVSAMGGTFTGLLMIGAATAFFLIGRRLPEAVFIFLTGSNFVVTALIKVLVARPRPPYYLLDPTDTFPLIDQYSYPSGHVLFFVVFFGFIAYLAWFYPAGRARMIVPALCGALILLIGPSRVYLGAHWASDVLGSYIIGTLWLVLIILGYRMALRRMKTGVEGSPV